MATLDRKFFFSQTRLMLFGGKFKQPQVDGLGAILDYWCAHHENEDDRKLAYLLGTAHHETGRTMQPIREWGGNTYFTRRYDPPPDGKLPDVAKALGNTKRGDGARFCGRGFVQLTGRSNYRDWSKRCGVDLIEEPDRAMELDIAVRILVEGSLLGTFTGKSLGHYFTPAKADWFNARRVINRLDKADLVASYAKSYYAAISYAG
jgi:hypothetical protein